MKNINKQNISEKVKGICKYRGQKRKALLNEISLNWIAYTKEQNLRAFPKAHLNYLCEDLPNRTRTKIVNEIISELLNKGLVEENQQVKSVYRWRNKTLSASKDFESYSVLMAKNGFKRKLYKQVGKKKISVGVLPIGEKITEDFDLSKIESFKPQEIQGVKLLGNSKSYERQVKKEVVLTTYHVL